MKNVIFKILVHVVVKMDDIQQALQMIVRNEVAKLYDEERHTLSSGRRPRPSPSEKVDPRPLEKADPIAKFTV